MYTVSQGVHSVFVSVRLGSLPRWVNVYETRCCVVRFFLSFFLPWGRLLKTQRGFIGLLYLFIYLSICIIYLFRITLFYLPCLDFEVNNQPSHKAPQNKHSSRERPFVIMHFLRANDTNTWEGGVEEQGHLRSLPSLLQWLHKPPTSPGLQRLGEWVRDERERFLHVSGCK